MADAMQWDDVARKWFMATLVGCLVFAAVAWLLVR
ncbi:hypothetical protein HRbin30_02514 [bacterium HR30]|jgi:hypothetical protein|nr:hypothetical protein HRbin30_02514 [bacterium HR30]